MEIQNNEVHLSPNDAYDLYDARLHTAISDSRFCDFIDTLLDSILDQTANAALTEREPVVIIPFNQRIVDLLEDTIQRGRSIRKDNESKLLLPFRGKTTRTRAGQKSAQEESGR